MNFLFCVQTIFEMDNPWIYTNYLTNYFRSYILSIQKEYPKSTFTILMGEAASYRYVEIPGVDVVVVTQQEMLNFGNFDHREVLSDYFKYCHERGPEPSYMKYHIQLLKDKILTYPDIIVSRDNAPYLEKIFPKACMLYTEVGFISRSPFQQTMYFDCLGMNCGSFLYKYWNDVEKTLDWNENKNSMVETIKRDVRSLLLNTSPYIDFLNAYKKKFAQIYLLPLQFSGFSNIDAEIDMKSQLDVVMYVLDRIPQSIGVVVTTHPDYNVLSDGNMLFLRKKYSNLIYDKMFHEYGASSQYILGSVDGVINLSSTVGLQTLFWDIPCLQIGKYFAHYVARRFDINSSYEALSNQEIENNNKVLYWMLTRYIVPPQYYQDAKWLMEYLMHIKENQKAGNIQDIYREIDLPENIFKDMRATLDRNIPEARKKDKAKQYYNLLMESSKRYFAHKRISKKLYECGKDILIYGKGSLAYLLELEMKSDEMISERYIGIIDASTYQNYKYSGKELIVITPIQDYEKIVLDLKSVSDSQCISFEELFYE